MSKSDAKWLRDAAEHMKSIAEGIDAQPIVPPKTRNLKHADALLYDIARDLRSFNTHTAKLWNLRVEFVEQTTPGGLSRTLAEFSLPSALDTIANDLYFDAEQGDWSAANRAVVTVI